MRPQNPQGLIGALGDSQPAGKGKRQPFRPRQSMVSHAARVVDAGNRRQARGNGGDGEGDHETTPEIEIPERHQIQRFGHHHHKGGGNGGKTGGDDRRFAGGVFAGAIHLISEQQAHRIAADKRSHRINRRRTRRFPQAAHHRLHQYAHHFQQAETDEEGQRQRADGNNHRQRQAQLFIQKRQHVFFGEHGRRGTGEIPQGNQHAGDFEQGQYAVGEAFVPTTAHNRRNGTVDHHQ